MNPSSLITILTIVITTSVMPILCGDNTLTTASPEIPTVIVDLILKQQMSEDNYWIPLDRFKYTALEIPYTEGDYTVFVQKAMCGDIDVLKNTAPNMLLAKFMYKEQQVESSIIPDKFPASFVEKLKKESKVTCTMSTLGIPTKKIIFKLKKREELLENSTRTTTKYFFYGATALGLIGLIIWLIKYTKNISILTQH